MAFKLNNAMHQPRRHRVSKKATDEIRRRLDAVVRTLLYSLDSHKPSRDDWECLIKEFDPVHPLIKWDRFLKELKLIIGDEFFVTNKKPDIKAP